MAKQKENKEITELLEEIKDFYSEISQEMKAFRTEKKEELQEDLVNIKRRLSSIERRFSQLLQTSILFKEYSAAMEKIDTEENQLKIDSKKDPKIARAILHDEYEKLKQMRGYIDDKYSPFTSRVELYDRYKEDIKNNIRIIEQMLRDRQVIGKGICKRCGGFIGQIIRK